MLLHKGFEVLGRVSDDALQNLTLFVDGVNSDSYHANDQLVFLRSVLAIDNPRLFKTGAVARQFSHRLTKSELFSDVDYAFRQPNVVGLSSHNGALLEHQISLIDQVASAAAEHIGVMMLLGLMKERLEEHYYHGLRAGIAFYSLCEVFDPHNKLPPRTKLIAGIIHDVGKLEVPRNILFKTGALDDKERRVMRRHDAANEHILAPVNIKIPHVSEVTSNHHLSSKKVSDNPDIESAGLRLRIADIYDALGSERRYKEAWAAQRVASTLHSYFPNNPEEIIYLLNAFPCPVR